ncbi:class I SAM-dependent methyltransferase [Streptomyces sp. NPDC026673]|uniref:class I SAM-dependent methyltransferase n=1 Tax=Streptomyces sp. NPDC026673 TaxID=3155724 RepID=UPI0033DBE8E0
MTSPELLPDHRLELTTVVANNTMNRERGLTGVNGYARELGLDPVAHLLARSAAPRWLDLCSGEGLALRQAAGRLPDAARLTGVDLVGPMMRAPLPPTVELITASVTTWTPGPPYDLITCVHGLHYVGDRLGVLTRAAGRLRPGGLLVAHLDPASIRWADGGPAGRFVLAALRDQGFAYNARHHRLTLTGPRTVSLPLRYIGADPAAGPNYTGQPAVAAHYDRET